VKNVISIVYPNYNSPVEKSPSYTISFYFSLVCSFPLYFPLLALDRWMDKPPIGFSFLYWGTECIRRSRSHHEKKIDTRYCHSEMILFLASINPRINNPHLKISPIPPNTLPNPYQNKQVRFSVLYPPGKLSPAMRHSGGIKLASRQ